MSFVRYALITVVVLGVVTPGLALAQTTTPPSSTPSQLDDVSKWTSKQWNRAKAKWAEEKEKWADWRKQAAGQNLTGRKSWSFLASCMTNCSVMSKGDEVIVEQVGRIFLYNACVRKLGDIDCRWLRLSMLEAIESPVASGPY